MTRSLHQMHVTVVSNNSETLNDFREYLRRAGVVTSSTRFMDRSIEVAPAWASAVVLFPDGFDREAVVAALASLGEHRPTALPVLVTKDPKQFACLPSFHEALLPLIVPRPAWGWTILDAIRARRDRLRRSELH